MPTKKEELTFEKSVERLEGLIQAMENGNTPLADLVAKFEEGSKLLNHCQAQLKEAEASKSNNSILRLVSSKTLTIPRKTN